MATLVTTLSQIPLHQQRLLFVISVIHHLQAELKFCLKKVEYLWTNYILETHSPSPLSLSH